MHLVSGFLKQKSLKKYLFFAVFVSVLVLTPMAFGAEEAAHGAADAASHGGEAAKIFLWIAIILVAAKLSSLVERFGQPSVLGELVMGVVLGNLALVGIHFFVPIASNEIIAFLAELGVVILLFQIGLESNIKEMGKVGVPAFLVAIVGVVAPFVLGTYLVGPWLLPGLDTNAYLFLGAALTATSVGITARVFQDLGKLNIREARIILGAAVIDDVLGLIILAVVSAIVTVGAVSIGAISIIVAKAVGFLIGSIILGQLLAKFLGQAFSRIHTGVAMKFTLAVSFGLVFAYLAQLIGLAPIVGAFAAGLVLDPVHFEFFMRPKVIEEIQRASEGADHAVQERINQVVDHHSHRHVEDLLEPLGHFLIPIFFIVTGMAVDLTTLFNGPILLTALGITAAAFIGKYISGFLAGKGTNKHLVGFGMVPRGEVGLIFASIGAGLGVIGPELFSVIVIMVIVTTLLAPPALAMILKRKN